MNCIAETLLSISKRRSDMRKSQNTHLFHSQPVLGTIPALPAVMNTVPQESPCRERSARLISNSASLSSFSSAQHP